MHNKMHKMIQSMLPTLLSFGKLGRLWKIQDAQLSQRDRAAGCMSFTKSERLEMGDHILRTL